MPKLSEVGCSRGAPMGRYSETPDLGDSFTGKVNLTKMVMVDACYDQGGAYWGCGSRESGWMYRCHFFDPGSEKEDWSIDWFFRAKSRGDAKRIVREMYPNARFYN